MLKNYAEDYMAGQLEISSDEYNQVENGRAPITLQMLLSIAAVLELELADLVGI